MAKWWQWVLLLLLAATQTCSAYKILCLFPHVAKSHFIMAETLMKALAERGHEVTVVSHFPQKQKIPNYRDISLVGSMPEFVNNVSLDTIATGHVHTTISWLIYMAHVNCENTLNFPAMQQLIASDEKFDLVVTELFNTDCLLGYVHKLGVPFIALSSSVLMPWGSGRYGLPDNPAYIPCHFLPHADRMNFLQRLINTVCQEGLKWVYHYMVDGPANEIARKHFGQDMPPLSEIARNSSLLLVNSHFSLNQPRPLVPAVVEVGGIHLQPAANKLPKDLETFLNEAKEGVIYFSMGSSVRAETFPEKKRDAFIQAFAELPQKVLWKWEGDTLPGQPKNVKIAKWLPQMDVLAHRNVKAFVTHGGLMGTMEAAANGVPMVAIPLFGDQPLNVQSYIEEGIAVKLDYMTISKETVLTALKTVLNDRSYAVNAKRVQKAFHERPMPPLDTAIYWTEYVIRNNGARHMRSAAVDLSWYQYFLLDVIVVLLLAASVIIALLYLMLRKLFSLCCGKKDKQTQKSKAKKS